MTTTKTYICVLLLIVPLLIGAGMIAIAISKMIREFKFAKEFPKNSLLGEIDYTEIIINLCVFVIGLIIFAVDILMYIDTFGS